MYDPATDPAKLKFTVAEILDAMEKNGYPKGKHDYIFYEVEADAEGHEIGIKVSSACALGQAALNLNVNPASLYDALTLDVDDEDYDGDYNNWGEDIAGMNDGTDKSIQEIAQYFREQMKEYLNIEVYLSR